MDLTAFYIRLLTNALMLLLFVHNGSSHKTERTFPRIVPSNLQMLEYSSLTVNCKGYFSHLTEWRVMRNIKKMNNAFCSENQLGACHINITYADESGEYWCETKTKQRSEKITITVTGGDVVLESPVGPVMVGDNVTLRCLGKNGLHQNAEFYKNGNCFKTSENGETTLYNVSVSEQGQYSCKQGSVSSESSWLTVRDDSFISVHNKPTLSTFSPLILLVPLPVLFIVLGFTLNKDEAAASEEFQQRVTYSIISDYDVNTDQLKGYDFTFWIEVMYSTVGEKSCGETGGSTVTTYKVIEKQDLEADTPKL